jgi:hypothetical protein
MNDSKNSSKGLLVLRYPERMTVGQLEGLTGAISPLADALGVEPLVLDGGADARLEYGTSALLERVCVALEALVAQGQPPELSEPQIAPQALNARPSHLNPADYTLSKGEKVSTGLNSRPAELNAATLADMWARRNDKI